MAAIIKENTSTGFREMGVIVFVTWAAFVFIALVTFSYEDSGWTHSGSGGTINNACGVIGAWVADFIFSLLGLSAFFFPVMIAWHGYQLFMGRSMRQTHWGVGSHWGGFVLSSLAISTLAYLYILRLGFPMPNGAGGIIGEELGDLLVVILGHSGVTLVLLTILLGGITLLTNLSWLAVIDGVGKYALVTMRFLGQKINLGVVRCCVYVKSYFQRTTKAGDDISEVRLSRTKKPSLPRNSIAKKIRVEPTVGAFESTSNIEPVMTLIEPSLVDVIDPPMTFSSFPAKKHVSRRQVKKTPVANKGLPELSLLD
jgi:S-DNA-T family DNA segregation ATPase FtsK/SpoIIIE